MKEIAECLTQHDPVFYNNTSCYPHFVSYQLIKIVFDVDDMSKLHLNFKVVLYDDHQNIHIVDDVLCYHINNHLYYISDEDAPDNNPGFIKILLYIRNPNFTKYKHIFDEFINGFKCVMECAKDVLRSLEDEPNKYF